MERELFLKELLEKAEKINLPLKESAIEKLYDYMNLLLEWNEKMNLTAIVEPREIILKHFIDSMVIYPYLKKAKKVLDIGTGAGFPGIPLKILYEETDFTLMDALNKRILFLQEVCQTLAFKKIACIHGRAEELAILENYREAYDAVTSRAVARLNVLLEYMLPFTKVGGISICMKGADIEEELEEAKKAIQILGGKIEKVETSTLPDSDMIRNTIIIRKIDHTPKKYPRKAGMPGKQPIM